MYVPKNLEATILFVDFSKAFDSIHREKVEQILLAYGLPKETVAAIVMLYRKMKVKVRFPDGDTGYFEIVAAVLQEDTLASYLFIILERLLIKWKTMVSSWQRKKEDTSTQTITNADNANDIAKPKPCYIVWNEQLLA